MKIVKNLKQRHVTFEITDKLALKLTKTNLKKIDKDLYTYTGVNNTCKLKFNLPSYYMGSFCDFSNFVKDGICMHLVAYSWLYEKDLYKNYSNKTKNFAICTKRGRHKKTAKAGQFN